MLQRRYVEKLEADRGTVRLGGGTMRLQSLLRRRGDCSRYITSQREEQTSRKQEKTRADMMKQNVLQGEK